MDDKLSTATLGEMDNYDFAIDTDMKENTNKSGWNYGVSSGLVKTGFIKDDPDLISNHAKGMILVEQVNNIRNLKNWDFFKRSDKEGGISWLPCDNDPPKMAIPVGDTYIYKSFYDKSIDKLNNDYFTLNLGKKIKIGYPIDTYENFEDIVVTYSLDGKNYFTPEKLFQTMHKFYHETVPSLPEKEAADEFGNEELFRCDILGYRFFDGFRYDEETGVHHLLLSKAI